MSIAQKPPPPPAPPGETPVQKPSQQDVSISNYHFVGISSRRSAALWWTADSDPDVFVGTSGGDMYIDAAVHLQLESSIHRHNVSGAVTQFFSGVDKKVEKKETVLINGSNTIHCNQSHIVTIVGDHALSTAASQTTVVGGGQEITVKAGGRNVNITGNLTETIMGTHKTSVSGQESVTVGGSKKVFTNDSWDWKILGPFVSTKGSTENALTASLKIALSASAEASYTCGLFEKASAASTMDLVMGKKTTNNFAAQSLRSYGPKYDLFPKRKEKGDVNSDAKTKTSKDTAGMVTEKSTVTMTNHSNSNRK